MFCTECKQWCETYREDLSFNYSGTHCTFGMGGTHRQWGDDKSVCCDADVTDFIEDEEER